MLVWLGVLRDTSLALSRFSCHPLALS